MAEQDGPSAAPTEGCIEAQVEMFALYLKCTRECMEGVQRLPSPKFYNMQCEYLVEKLQKFVDRIAGVVVDRLQGSCVDAERRIEVLKLALVLAKKIESFVKSCSDDSYIHAAMALTNTSDYVASKGFDLELCSIALCKDEGCTARLTLNEVQAKYDDEVKEVEEKVSEDVRTLVTIVLHQLCEEALKNENRLLAIYLLQRLNRMDPIASSIPSPLYSVIDDQGILGAVYKWVRPGKSIGRGSTATVYEATWLGTQVAKKTFMGRENPEFLKEAETLSKLNHPNITSMFCCEKDRWSSSLIMEIMDGDLHMLMLERCRRSGCDNPPFTIFEAVDIMLQIGEGVNYLHEKGVCHKDLKSLNILVKSMLTSQSEVEVGCVHAKVADFGLSKTKNSTTLKDHTPNIGTPRWMAPEIIGRSGGNTFSQPKYPFKIDVHGFAMLCYEILTGYVPFHHEANPRIIKKYIKSGIRPELPSNCPPELKALIQECWDKSPKERPSFPNICSRLKYVKYLLMTGFCSSEDTQAPTETQVAEDTQAATETQVAEDTQVSTKSQVAEDTQASAKTQVAEDTQASTKTQVAEDTQASTKTQVAEDTQASAKTQLAEDTQDSTETQVAEDTQAATETQVAEDTQASTKSQVAEDTQASAKTQVAEDTQASAKTQLAEDTQASTETQVAEDTQASTTTQVAEDAQASTKTLVAEDPQVATENQVAEDTQAATETQVAEDTQASTKSQVAEDTQASTSVESEAVPGFSSLDGDLRSTFLNLIQVSNLLSIRWVLLPSCGESLVEVEEACRLLAVVRDQKPSDIRRFIFELSALKLVNFVSNKNEEFVNVGTPYLDLSILGAHKKFLENVLCKNPDFDIWLEVNNNLKSASFANAPVSLSLQRVRVLGLYDCQVVECVDLSNFPELRVLSIWGCPKLRAVKGWEVVKALGWLDISVTGYSMDFPRVQCLPSLREFRYKGKLVILEPGFTQCVRLRRLEIIDNESLNSIDLSTLRFLEVLKFRFCSGLTTIQGLSGLHSLTKLEIVWCRALRRVPELGCLKALTHLYLAGSGVEEIAGVQELHLLTALEISSCSLMETLPHLGHLKALAYLDISWSGVEEIPGVEDLVSLEALYCEESRLKRLPDLHHLRQLRVVWIYDTPLSTDSDPSSFYYGKKSIEYNPEEGRMGC